MTLGGPIGWWNTGFPVLLLSVLAVALPYALRRRHSVSHTELAVVIWACAGCLMLAGGALFALVYQWQGADVAAALGDRPWATIRFFLGRGLSSALVWGPVLGLVWFGLAQGIEAERARHLMREDIRND